MTGSRPAPPSGAQDRVDEAHALLVSYREVLQRADRLSLVLWTRGGWHGRWWVPRLTVGTSLFARLHVLRATDELSRAYTARAALGDLDDDGHRRREMVDAFRASIRPPHVRRLVFAGVVAVLLVGRLLVSAVAAFVAKALDRASGDDVGNVGEAQRVIDGVATAATALSGASLTGIVESLEEADAGTRALLVGSLLAAAYVVCRPLFPGFRVKRVLWNLADEPAGALTTTVPSWHVPRATGLYARERRVLTAEGCSRIPREMPLDVVLSAVLALVLGGVTVAANAADPEVRYDPGVYLLSGGPALLRLSWLVAVVRGRAGQSDPLPTSVRLPVTGRTVVARRPEPAVALGLLFLPVPLLWYRQARGLQAVLAEDAAQRRVPRRAAPRPLLALAAVTSLWLSVPLMAARALRLLAAGGRLRPLVLLLAVAASGGVALSAFYASDGGTVASNLAFSLWWLAGAVCLGLSDVVLGQRLREAGTALASTGEARDGDAAVVFAAPPGWPVPPEGWLPEPAWRPDPAWPSAPAGWRFLRPAERHPPDEPIDVRLPNPRREVQPPDEAALPRPTSDA